MRILGLLPIINLFVGETVNNEDTLIPEPQKKILIIEDREDLRELLSLMLKDKDYLIYDTGDSNEAIEIFHKHKPDLIISDYKLDPQMSGLDLLKYFRREAGKNIHTILLSAAMELDTPVMREHFENNNIHFITKPFSILALFNKVGNLLA